MSTFYRKNNNESTISLFNKRVIYDFDLPSYGFNNIVNFNFGEKLLFGKVNRFFIPVQVNSNALVPLARSVNTDTPAMALNFVADAFNAMAQQFDKQVQNGQISADEPYLSSLVAYGGRAAHETEYRNYSMNFMTILKSTFQKNKIICGNFEQFISELENVFPTTIDKFPFTKTAYMKSRLCPVSVSGLTIEIADLNYSNDEEKILQFTQSKNWKFYVNACNSYGFMIDRAAPWRIVADIDADGIREISQKYGYRGASSILNGAYVRVAPFYYQRFNFNLLSLYNNVKMKKYYIPQECNGRVMSKKITPITYSVKQFQEKFPEEYFLRLYCKIRFMEEESHFDENSQQKLIGDTVVIYQNKNIGTAINNFERIVNKPFDYRGSLSYINRQIKARE